MSHTPTAIRVPAPDARPGDHPHFEDMYIPEAGHLARPDPIIPAREIRDYAFDLIRVLDDGRIEVDNNRCENAIRPFVLGRKAWLFADTPAGATASARLYSLIETAKANGIKPDHYLNHLFKELPYCSTLQECA